MESNEVPLDAATSLELVAKSRSSLADRVVTPWWYHLILGLLIGGLIAVQATDSNLWTSVGLIIFTIGVGSLVWTYRHKTGVWVSGFHPGPARAWAVAMGVAVLIGYVPALFFRLVAHWWPGPLICGALVVVAVIVIGRKYDEVLRNDLRSGAV